MSNNWEDCINLQLARSYFNGQRWFSSVSLAKLRNIKEEGVTFASHIDGRKIFMGPEESMRIQSHLGSTIAMAFDECIENPAAYEYVKQSCASICAGYIAVRKKWSASMPKWIPSIANNGCGALTKEAPMKI